MTDAVDAVAAADVFDAGLVGSQEREQSDEVQRSEQGRRQGEECPGGEHLSDEAEGDEDRGQCGEVLAGAVAGLGDRCAASHLQRVVLGRHDRQQPLDIAPPSRGRSSPLTRNQVASEHSRFASSAAAAGLVQETHPLIMVVLGGAVDDRSAGRGRPWPRVSSRSASASLAAQGHCAGRTPKRVHPTCTRSFTVSTPRIHPTPRRRHLRNGLWLSGGLLALSGTAFVSPALATEDPSRQTRVTRSNTPSPRASASPLTCGCSPAEAPSTATTTTT